MNKQGIRRRQSQPAYFQGLSHNSPGEITENFRKSEEPVASAQFQLVRSK